MKKKILILTLLVIAMNANAQLEKGKHVVGVQLPIIVNDMYYTRLAFDLGPNQKHYGISIVPSYAFVIDHNWLLGVQAILGVETFRYPNGKPFSSITKETYTDLGIAPFTRYYIDVSKNKTWKIFGVAALELNTANSKYFYTTGTSITGASFTTTTGSLGGGIAWFGKKIAIDASMSNTALRLGIYRILPGKKK